MIKCLYIAGTLFITDGQQAVSLGPNTRIEKDDIHITVYGPRMVSRLVTERSSDTVDEMLWQCDEEATKAIMERPW